MGLSGGLGAGVLNPHRLAVSGYSVGAQMVSWMMQVQAIGEMAEYMNATVKAGAFFAGGTYACYRGNYFGAESWRPPPPPPPPPSAAPFGQCKGCNASNSCMMVGCSNKVRALSGKPPVETKRRAHTELISLHHARVSCGSFQASVLNLMMAGRACSVLRVLLPGQLHRAVLRRPPRGVPSRRRRDCHFDDTPCLSLLKHLITVQGGATK